MYSMLFPEPVVTSCCQKFGRSYKNFSECKGCIGNIKTQNHCLNACQLVLYERLDN